MRAQHHADPYAILGICAASTVAYVALRSWTLLDYGLWFDEVFSVEAAQSSWQSLLPFAAADAVHPPLFYILLKLWVAFGGVTLLWLKILPLAISIFALIPLYLLCRDLSLGLVDLGIVLWLVTVNPYLIYYSQELRMYSLLLCLTLWSLWWFLRLSRTATVSPWHMSALFATNLLLVYTHYFGWLVVGTQGLCVLIWRRGQLVPFSISVAALVLCFAPWVYAVVSASATPRLLPGTLRWINRPTAADLAAYFATLHGLIPLRHSTSVGIMLFTLPLLVLLRRIARGQSVAVRQRFFGLCLFSFVPVGAAFMGSQMFPQSVWGARHLIVAAVPYFLLLAVALAELHPGWCRVAAIILITGWAGIASATALSRAESRLSWSRLAVAMADREADTQEKVKIYAFETWVAAPLGFSLHQMGKDRFQIVVITDPDSLRGRHFWMVFRNTVGHWRETPLALLARRGCRIGAEVSVHGSAQQLTLLPVECPAE